MISSFAAHLNRSWKFCRHPMHLTFLPGLSRPYVYRATELAIAFGECTRTYLAYLSKPNKWPPKKDDQKKRRVLQDQIIGLPVLFRRKPDSTWASTRPADSNAEWCMQYRWLSWNGRHIRTQGLRSFFFNFFSALSVLVPFRTCALLHR